MPSCTHLLVPSAGTVLPHELAPRANLLQISQRTAPHLVAPYGYSPARTLLLPSVGLHPLHRVAPLAYLVFVIGRGGVSFPSPDPALTRGQGEYVSGNPRPAPVRGPPALIPWTGPHLLPPIFNRGRSGVWVGRGPERGQGQGMPEKAPRTRPLSGARQGIGSGAGVFRAPVRPVANSAPTSTLRRVNGSSLTPSRGIALLLCLLSNV